MTQHENGIPRPEHPRPQQHRENWQSLNGTWTCRRHRFPLRHPAEPTLQRGRSLGREDVGPFDETITVPFAPESVLSGIGVTDFSEGIDYHRRVSIPADWAGLRVLLHFGGVDFHADFFVDGSWVGSHSGGSAPFTVDLTDRVRPGAAHDLTVEVQDYIHAGDQPGGKQSHYARSYGCYYTRTTGIWQTVWLEAVHPAGLADVAVVPDVRSGAFVLIPTFRSARDGLAITARASRDGVEVARSGAAAKNGIPFALPIPEPQRWRPDDPVLYDLDLTVEVDGEQVDRVRSYGGLREIELRDGRFFVNGSSVYLRFVLDQGFYPNGIWTAPSDDALRRDIELSMAAGFNGARLHQKVFEDRFHYWADRLGYLTWSEWPSWGFEYNSAKAARYFLTEVREVVTHLRNHPSIIAWTPFNETRDFTNPRAHHVNHVDAYEVCKSVDPTRPVNDASGYIHHRTDIYTVHTYKPTAEELRAQLEPETSTEAGGTGSGGTAGSHALRPFRNFPEREAGYAGEPYVVDEFGGVKWQGPAGDGQNKDNRDQTEAWGYGGTPRTEDEFFGRLRGLVDTLLDFDHVAGWCYTQLTDVEQEQNGVYYYDRTPKFDAGKVREVFARKPDGYEL